jgi:hypothetical protein
MIFISRYKIKINKKSNLKEGGKHREENLSTITWEKLPEKANICGAAQSFL